MRSALQLGKNDGIGREIRMLATPLETYPRVAVLGCGYWGKNLVRNFHAIGALAAVVDPAADARAKANAIAPGSAVHPHLAAVLNDPTVQGVVIATPAATHAALCELALLAGKDVFCEKPLALRYEDARRVAELAEKQGRILMVGHVLEYHPAILKLRGMIAEDTLGPIRYIYSNRLNFGRVRHEENILWSFAPHDIAVILRLFGAMPVQVTCAGGAFLQPSTWDVTVTQMQFDHGRAAHIFVSWLNPFKEQKLVIVGEKRMATFDDVRRELVLHDQRMDADRGGAPVLADGGGSRVEYARDEPLRLECEAFLRAVRTRQQPLTDAESALRVLTILQAAQRSLSHRGQPVLLPLG